MTQNLSPVYTGQVQIPNNHLMAFHCKDCNKREDMVTAFDASGLVNITLREIYRLAENGTLHYKVTSEGKLFICVSSLLGNSSKTTQPLNNYLLRMKWGKS
jgi:hypothetical protein